MNKSKRDLKLEYYFSIYPISRRMLLYIEELYIPLISTLVHIFVGVCFEWGQVYRNSWAQLRLHFSIFYDVRIDYYACNIGLFCIA